MKKLFVFILAISAGLFWSCTKDDKVLTETETLHKTKSSFPQPLNRLPKPLWNQMEAAGTTLPGGAETR